MISHLLNFIFFILQKDSSYVHGYADTFFLFLLLKDFGIVSGLFLSFFFFFFKKILLSFTCFFLKVFIMFLIIFIYHFYTYSPGLKSLTYTLILSGTQFRSVSKIGKIGKILRAKFWKISNPFKHRHAIYHFIVSFCLD